MGDITVKDDAAPFGGTVTFLDAKGFQTQPEDTPQWSSSDEGVATVSASADGLGATLAAGNPGVALIECRSTQHDDQTGEPHEVIAQGTVTVQAADAVIGSIEFGAAPEPAPEPEPTP